MINEVEEFRSDRHFWLKEVFGRTHRVMTFTSERDPQRGLMTRVEIYFGHAGLMLVYPEMKGLVIRPARKAELQELIVKHGLPNDTTNVYLLESEGRQGFVASAAPAWREAKVAYDAPSLFSESWPPHEGANFGSVAKAE